MQPLLPLPSGWPAIAVAVAGLVAVAWVANWAASRILTGAVRRVASRTRSTWDDRLIERNVFARMAHVVPALVIYAGIGPALGLAGVNVAAADAGAAAVLWIAVQRVCLTFVVFVAARSFKGFLDAVNDIYNDSYAQAKSRPVKGYLQVLSLVAYLAAAIVAAALLAGRSPVVFLSGLGALTAVLMLVFKDTILSLAASVQIMSNDMVRIGDWVSMPQANSDGDVVDVALHTVKVQNWDKTISTIPTHKFISESFKNWRGMSESGGRRIKRSLRIDMNSVRFLTEQEVAALSRREVLRDYMREKQSELDRHNAGRADADADPETEPELRRMTNLGTFRAYVHRYLEVHPATHKDMTLLVRQLAPGPEGVPIEIYCFSNDTAWANYEAFQADVFDHLIAVLPEFGLKVFQRPTGQDFARAMGALT